MEMDSKTDRSQRRDPARRHAVLLPGAYVMLAVLDNGSGMSDITEEHILSHFLPPKEWVRAPVWGLLQQFSIWRKSFIVNNLTQFRVMR